MKRLFRTFNIKKALTGLFMATTALTSVAQETVKLGFIPLTDCAPLVIAKEKVFC